MRCLLDRFLLRQALQKERATLKLVLNFIPDPIFLAKLTSSGNGEAAGSKDAKSREILEDEENQSESTRHLAEPNLEP